MLVIIYMYMMELSFFMTSMTHITSYAKQESIFATFVAVFLKAPLV